MEGSLMHTRTRLAKATRGSSVRVGPAFTRPEEPVIEKRTIWLDLGLILIVCLATVALRSWLIAHTAVAARDSIGFIRYALALESQPYLDVFRNSQQHPGYPIVLLLVSWPVRLCLGGVNPLSMQLSAQIASGLASTILVVPMYFLGCHFFDRRAGFWGSLLFQILPVSGRAMSDGLSEATFLLFVSFSLLFAVIALHRNSIPAFLLSGFFGGCSYLTRPEGALVVLATLAVLLGKQCYKPWRERWLRVGECALALCTTALLIGGPYAYVIGGLTNKPTPRAILESRTIEGAGPEESLLWKRDEDGRTNQAGSNPLALRSTPPSRPLLASVVALYAPRNLHDRRWWALLAIMTELIKGYQYVLALPVLLGLWWYRPLLHDKAGTWALFLVGILHALVLWKLALAVGYVSERHILLLVLCGIFTGAATIGLAGDYLQEIFVRVGLGRHSTTRFHAATNTLTAGLLLATVAGFCLPDTFRTLHANRAGHRAAGIWLAQNANPGDSIIDPFCWAHYYAGRTFMDDGGNKSAADSAPSQYVVVEPSDHARLPTVRSALDLASRGHLVYYWPVGQPEDQAKVKIYAVP
jgi:Dolichyl-phosphate-mannose-protein mannosyltransferase